MISMKKKHKFVDACFFRIHKSQYVNDIKTHVCTETNQIIEYQRKKDENNSRKNEHWK